MTTTSESLFLRRLPADGVALAAAARRGPATAPVPGCPGWTLHDLVDHMGTIHRHVTRIVTGRIQHPVQRSDIPSGPDDLPERIAWYEEGLNNLVDALNDLDPEEPLWSWSMGVGPARFWIRRMAQETALHRWDAESAVGQPQPLDTALAVDGIDEMADVWFVRFSDLVRRVADDNTMHLHCTDADGEWLVHFTADGATVTREHAKRNVAVRAGASDLLLLLWNRVGPERAEVFGDASLLRRFGEVVRL
jgi:uncharacterized protein (TIGR03083 family)